MSVSVCVRMSGMCACGSHNGRWSCLETQGSWIRFVCECVHLCEYVYLCVCVLVHVSVTCACGSHDGRCS